MTQDEKKLFEQLESEFGAELADEMIIMIILGSSVDNAIQTVLGGDF